MRMYRLFTRVCCHQRNDEETKSEVGSEDGYRRLERCPAMNGSPAVTRFATKQKQRNAGAKYIAKLLILSVNSPFLADSYARKNVNRQAFDYLEQRTEAEVSR